jgi:dihydroorotase
MVQIGKLVWWAICAHVHCRDGKQSYKTTIAEVIQLALSQGVGMVFDMPNTDPPVLTRHDVWKRLALVPENMRERYRLYVGLTGDESQVIEALWCYNNIPQVVGLKLYVGKSVGDLSVIDVVLQRMIYRILAREGFQGVLALHCEKEELMNPELWNPSNPITHGLARPEVSEFGSVTDQIAFALAEKYSGKLHFCHVSSPITVHLVDYAKSMGLKASCGLTPQHAMWDESMMSGVNGIVNKVNPPLRRAETVIALRELLLAGKIDIIETDHAKHAKCEKESPPYLSGIPSMNYYRSFVQDFLPKLGLSAQRIKALTCDNVVTIFGDKMTARR